MKIVGLVTVDHVIDDAAIVVVLYWWTSVWAKAYLLVLGLCYFAQTNHHPVVSFGRRRSGF